MQREKLIPLLNIEGSSKEAVTRRVHTEPKYEISLSSQDPLRKRSLLLSLDCPEKQNVSRLSVFLLI